MHMVLHTYVHTDVHVIWEKNHLRLLRTQQSSSGSTLITGYHTMAFFTWTSCVCLLISWDTISAFTNHQGRARASPTALTALTERQLQFWEDVDAGLDDIENFYAKKNQNIDRIRRFAKT
jgi:hypothetical protein